MVARVTSALGAVDILVNNAGVSYRGDLGDADDAQIEEMRRINVDGVIAATRAVVDGMKARRFGRIVNVASIAALGTAMAGTTFYAATKAAVVVLTRRFALELGRRHHGERDRAGLRPHGHGGGGRTEADFAAIAARTMVRRIGRPEDIATRWRFSCRPSPDS